MDEDSNMSNASTSSLEGQIGTKGEGNLTSIVSIEGVRYTGETNKDGKREGKGECVWPNNDRYVGDFVDGVKQGNGILYFSNGDKRVGVWKEDKLHGRASYYYSGGRIDAEVWEDDHKVSEQRIRLSPF